MKNLCGYLKAIYHYYQDPKGHHDIVDYARASLIMVTTIVVVLIAIKLICEK
ncbi:MAG: hypothetical protein K0Q53_1124 [Massilibacillus sp.]|jgi:hypothetical protein|nr:hypothetical protein [Massilibacillus sp.]